MSRIYTRPLKSNPSSDSLYIFPKDKPYSVLEKSVALVYNIPELHKDGTKYTKAIIRIPLS